jgi:hypothetical protein
VKEFQVDTIVDALCSNMLSDKEQLKDISSIGLKTVIAQLPQVPSQTSSNIVKKITSRLLNTIQKVLTIKYALISIFEKQKTKQKRLQPKFLLFYRMTYRFNWRRSTSYLTFSTTLAVILSAFILKSSRV